MPQDLYKWEDGGILKHHCPICQTPLSHDKCRTTCLGKHVEWCHRYHSLFRKNWSSRCQACKTTDEQHEKRHREIAEILARIRNFKLEEEVAAAGPLMSPMTPRTPRTPLTAKALNTVGPRGPLPPFMLDTPKASKKERKAAKKAAKARDRDKVVTTADIDFVAKALHSEPEEEERKADVEAQGMDMDADIKFNLMFNSTTWNTKLDRHEYIIKERGGKYQIEEHELERLLQTFDVDTQAVGREKDLVDELILAIKSDLVHVHDELQMTARLKAGFWRWANKKHYRDLVDNGREWDDKNGKKHPSPDPIEQRRDSAAMPTETDSDDDDRTARSDSIGTQSLTGSAGTSLTIPSSKAAPSAKKAPVLTLSVSVKDQAVQAKEESGWARVGKKVLKAAPTGKITLSGNGGLQHFAQKPKDRFGALSWADAAKSD